MELAAASLDDVLHEWQGLGYYARARNLHACARFVARELGGLFPDTEDELRRLPGIGDYTAAAIAAIAFGRPSAPVDGNIIRVISRLKAIEAPMPANKAMIAPEVNELLPEDRAGDFAQAMMDLGAMVCTPKSPQCRLCPWEAECAAHAVGQEPAYPVMAPKKVKSVRHGVVFWLEDREGRVLLRRRSEKGLLGGMMEFPSTDWTTDQVSEEEQMAQSPVDGSDWSPISGEVKHTFTHFHLRLRVLRRQVSGTVLLSNGYWASPADFGDYALPTVMKKVAALVARSG